MNRRDFLAAVVVIGIISAIGIAPSYAGKSAVYTGVIAGVAAAGYDVVAYQTQSAAVPGNEAISVERDGVSYRFVSEKNRVLFVADPARYAPQYGGYCAFAVAQGATAHGDPEQWNVVGGKLYLNYSQPVRDRWNEDVSGNISKADGHWPDVLN